MHSSERGCGCPGKAWVLGLGRSTSMVSSHPFEFTSLVVYPVYLLPVSTDTTPHHTSPSVCTPRTPSPSPSFPFATTPSLHGPNLHTPSSSSPSGRESCPGRAGVASAHMYTVVKANISIGKKDADEDSAHSTPSTCRDVQVESLLVCRVGCRARVNVSRLELAA